MKKFQRHYIGSRKLFTLFSGFLMLLHIQMATAQWTQTRGPQGGSVTALAQIGTTIYAGTAGGQIYSVSGFGNEWVKENSGLPYYKINAILPAGMFAATYGGGIYLSTDLGINWTESNSGLGNLNVNTLVQSGTMLLAGTDSGMYYSSDNAATWNICQSGLTSSSRINSTLLSGSEVYASTIAGAIFSSNDNGINWNLKGNILAYSHLVLSDSDTLYEENFGLIRESDDGGVTWNFWSHLNNYEYVTAMIKTGSSFIAGSPTGVQISTDNGTSWQHSTDKYVFALMLSGANLFMGDVAGVSISYDNGLNWTYSNEGLVASGCNALAWSGGDLFTEDYETKGVIRSEDDGASWSIANDGLVFTPDPWYGNLITDGNNLFLFNYYDWFKWSPFSSSWSELPNPGFSFGFIALDSPDIYVVPGDSYDPYLYHSSDYGVTWENILITDSLDHIYEVSVLNGEVYTIVHSPNYTNNIYYSSDNGSTFSATNLPLDSFAIPCCLFLSDSALYVRYFDGGTITELRSLDQGATWDQIGQGVFNFVWDLKFSGTNIFAATDSGVLLSNDKGDTWTSVNDGLSNLKVYSLALSSTEIYAPTYGAGVWKRPLQNILSAPDVEADAFSFSIYPNPFQRSTTLHYKLQKNSTVSLEVFDLFGQKVKMILRNESQIAGEYQYSFSGNSEGIYFVRMIVDGIIFSKKIIQVR
ncbi:MAG: T9SS type A sorting domain-containing protein [Chitinophagales bacterium]|nr:T9SS type A sorting domain-containing protein [Chitinophagales bacterium]